MKKNRLILFFLIICHLSLASWADTEAETKYPIVLVHGLYGYGGKLGFSAPYWGKIPNLLKEHGAEVLLANVSQAHKTEKRGQQLYRQLLRFSKRSGHTKFNLVGHSLGGLDVRYVLGNYPDMVASVTTIGTPHQGSKVADVVWSEVTRDSMVLAVSRAAGDLLGYSIAALSGRIQLQNSKDAVESLTTKSMVDFNKKYALGIGDDRCGDGQHEDAGRRFYSWGSYGVSPASRTDLVGQLFAKASEAFEDDEQNDGLVALCSMKFGKWLGEREGAHHLIPVGGVITPIAEEDRIWAEEMFLQHAMRLKRKGL